MRAPANLCAEFAGDGTINLSALHNGGPRDVDLTSAPVIFENLVIVGSAIRDNHQTNIRAVLCAPLRTHGQGTIGWSVNCSFSRIVSRNAELRTRLSGRSQGHLGSSSPP